MAAKQRISLRHVRALKPGEIIWDTSLPWVRRASPAERGGVLRAVLSHEGRPAALVHDWQAWRTLDT